MSSVEYLREFVSKRLTAAAEEIFGVFRKTIVEYEEEIDRQRRLLDIALKPDADLNTADPPELPQRHVFTEEKEDVLADQQLCNQERSFSLDQEDPEPPQIKEELEEPCSSLDEEQLVVKLEIPTYEENEYSELQSNSDHQLPSNSSHAAGSQNQDGGEHEDLASTRKEPEPTERHHVTDSHSHNTYKPNTSEIHTGENSFKCDTCGKTFRYRSKWYVHLRSHTGEKPYFCEYCEKRFTHSSSLNAHVRLHTGEKPYSCQTCGEGFRLSSGLLVHMRTHTGEKPYYCETCGKDFPFSKELRVHMRTHTGEKPYLCQICGKTFNQKSELKTHARVHTGEKPYCCNMCGKSFTQLSSLTVHIRVHTGEKPYVCQTCGKGFIVSGHLKIHMRRAHTGERPYLCTICGNRYFDASHLAKHTRTHASVSCSGLWPSTQSGAM